jgi:ferredoxin--NADP+ reductase
LGTLQRARAQVLDKSQLSGGAPILQTFRDFEHEPRADASVTIDFHFGMTPIAFSGTDRVERAKFRCADSSERELPADLVVTCIGYESLSCCNESPTNGVFKNDDGKIKDRLFVVGWAKRGPSGVIASSRNDAQMVAQKIAKEVTAKGGSGGEALRRKLAETGVSFVDHPGWKRINAAEVARAGEQRCRNKFASRAQMLEAAQDVSAQ